MSRRVVVTGLGAVTAIGVGAEQSWKALCEGKSGIGLVTAFDSSPFRSKIAGEVKDFDPEDFMDKKVSRRMDRFIVLAIAAARMAVEDARLLITPANCHRTGVAIGTALGGVSSVEQTSRLLAQSGADRVSPFFVPGFLCSMAAAQLSMQFGARGPSLCPVTACAAGNNAIGDSFKLIQNGVIDVALAGGAEAPVTPVMFAGLDALKVTSARNSEPARASRPFDKDRDGMVMAEGAGVVVLEDLETALRRGAKIYAEVVGYGYNTDGYHITSPDPSGEQAARCMAMALNDAGMRPEDIDHINAHGTSTQMNDRSETLAIKQTFGEYSRKLAISSNKSMVGHSFGAAPAVEAVFACLTLRDGVVPPTINYEKPDPDCDLDYVPNEARRMDVKTVLSNAFGFGGHNAVVIFRKVER
ncbi:MAG: beta-ketoacyl-[acyl-carrier-protein] synthase [Dehalococcoidia bacterium]|nr:beta-ketoacyl-[acyl-carrier-protein] synthase [Dehalococcoidia bacterium]